MEKYPGYFEWQPCVKTVSLPKGDWTLAVNGEAVNDEGIETGLNGSVTIDGTAAWVLYGNK